MITPAGLQSGSEAKVVTCDVSDTHLELAQKHWEMAGVADLIHFKLGPASDSLQVWPLAQFFLIPFCKNSLICLEGKSMTPQGGNTILFRSSQQLPRLRLGPSKGFLS